MQGYRDAVDTFEDCMDHVDVLLKRAEDQGCVAQDVDAF
jgi:hypothetical protein